MAPRSEPHPKIYRKNVSWSGSVLVGLLRLPIPNPSKLLAAMKAFREKCLSLMSSPRAAYKDLGGSSNNIQRSFQWERASMTFGEPQMLAAVGRLYLWKQEFLNPCSIAYRTILAIPERPVFLLM
jgi:hypothetical protein